MRGLRGSQTSPSRTKWWTPYAQLALRDPPLAYPIPLFSSESAGKVKALLEEQREPTQPRAWDGSPAAALSSSFDDTRFTP
jgi:hypothetical protein